MKVLVKKVGMNPEVREVKDEIKTYQEIVGGYIEVFTFLENTLCICNEEGKLMNLPVNFIYMGDAICGDVVFINESGEDFCSLTDEQIETLKMVFDSIKKVN